MTLLFEHPLNNKYRSYLRLEFLHNQILLSGSQDDGYLGFYPFFALYELFELCDFRPDVLKDIEQHIAQLNYWSTLQGVDHNLIKTYIEDLEVGKASLNGTTKFTEDVKKNLFLSSLRQRLSIPGGCCSCDLPQLHYWLKKPLEQRQCDLQEWASCFDVILNPVKIFLRLTRQCGEFKKVVAKNGLYQGSSKHNLSLIRIEIDERYDCYPRISGLENLYTIHFTSFTNPRETAPNVEFYLSTCP